MSQRSDVAKYDPTTPDAALIDACRDIESDDFEAAFAELYRRYRDRVYSIGYRMTGNAVDAMDVVQDSFRVLFQKIGSFRADSKFTTWLYRLVVNCSIDHKRRESTRTQRVSASLSLVDPTNEPVDPTDDPVACANSHELEQHVHAALGRLTPKLRAVLVLRYLEGLSYEELADTLQVQLGTIKSRLARAHVALERVLATSLPDYDYPYDGLEDGFTDEHSTGSDGDLAEGGVA